ncbi:MAG: DMT family transporter [Syntrophomonadaceae bacterium]|nr:DMT family transporter [Syntrophomonadaceae bacterium]MDD4550308.1 DMT family transporter [Syntrophomonadaceae bacterium]
MLKNCSDHILGTIFILLSALAFATLPIFGKMSYAVGLDPVSANLLRYIFAVIFLALYIKLRDRRNKILVISPLIITQGVLLTLASLFYFFSLQYISAGLTTIIFFIHPVLVAIMAIIIFKEKYKFRLLVAFVLAIAGIVLISGTTQTLDINYLKGLVFSLVSSIFYAIYSIIGQKTVANNDTLTLTCSLSIIAAVATGVYYLPHIDFLFHITLNQMLITAVMAIINTWLAVIFFLNGIKKIGASRGSLISSAEPPFCVILAFLMLGEKLTILELIGSVLVFVSVILAATSDNNSVASELSSESKNPVNTSIKHEITGN